MSKTVQERGLIPKVRFPEFECEWRIASALGPLTKKVGSGITPPGGSTVYVSSGLPFVRSQNVGWGILILDDIAFINTETHASFKATEIKESDVLLNITGASIGRSAVADGRVEGGNVNQHVCIIRTDPLQLSPEYLCRWLNSEMGQKQIDSFQAGGNRQGLNFQQVRSFALPTPVVDEQRKIAECLESLDELIAAETEKLDALKRHKKGLLQQLFPAEGETTPRLRFPNFRNCGEWREHKLSDVCTLISGQHLEPHQYASRGRLPYFSGPSDLTNNILRAKKWVNESNNTAHFGDILVTVKGSGAGGVWMSSLEEVALGRQLMALRTTGCDAQFVYQYMLTRIWRLEVMAAGNLIPGLSRPNLLTLSLPLPLRDEQKTIASLLHAADDEIEQLAHRIDLLARHKAALMQQLFPSLEELDASTP